MIKAIVLSKKPPMVSIVVNGKDLAEQSRVSTREADKKFGYQRVLDEKRIKQIAHDYIDAGHTFPTSVVLAVDGDEIDIQDEPGDIIEINLGQYEFLVIDGQHRIFAFKESEQDGPIQACLVWTSTFQEKAKLFRDVNWEQKPISKSLYYDLLREIRDEDEDFPALRAADLTHFMNEDEFSPLYQRVDMIGSLGGKFIRQASFAGTLENILKRKSSKFAEHPLEIQKKALRIWFSSIRDAFPDEYVDNKETIIWRPKGIQMALLLLDKLMSEEEFVPTPEKCNNFWDNRNDFDFSTEKWKPYVGHSGIRKIAQEVIDYTRSTEDNDEWVL